MRNTSKGQPQQGGYKLQRNPRINLNERTNRNEWQEPMALEQTRGCSLPDRGPVACAGEARPMHVSAGWNAEGYQVGNR